MKINRNKTTHSAKDHGRIWFTFVNTKCCLVVSHICTIQYRARRKINKAKADIESEFESNWQSYIFFSAKNKNFNSSDTFLNKKIKNKNKQTNKQTPPPHTHTPTTIFFWFLGRLLRVWSFFPMPHKSFIHTYRIVSNKRSPSNKRPLTYFQIKLGKMPKFLYDASL